MELIGTKRRGGKKIEKRTFSETEKRTDNQC